ncbi:MAG: epimerase [Alphaproteobacteria bacterium CG_4_10_14_0_2_um_filter_63_37]|nr:MAG: epimerase [Proteobacteria bacterium CG1_02_64_396]PJA25377.1 MAG: epimerase [Alphaproteobacteria bacterium CG_4_10_14_0_2_um_filter_63_37]
MNIILFGSSGMIGQAALRECLLDPNVESILAIVRKPSGFTHPKYQEQIHTDFLDFKPLEAVWRGYDGCFYLVGVTSSGMSDADYRRVTYDYTLAAAEALAALNPNMTFVYGSGAGADSSEKGSVMWARVRGATENAVLALPFKGVVFRPGFIVPMHGVKSKTDSYRWLYTFTRPFWGILRRLFPNMVGTSEQVARAMIAVVQRGAPKRVLEVRDINGLG